MTRTSRTLRTILTGYVTTVFVVILSFFIAPYIVGLLGNDGYGAYKVVTDYLGYFALLDFGFANSLQIGLAKALATNSRDRATALLRGASRSFFWLGLLSFALTLGFSIFVPQLVRTDAEYSSELRIGVAIAAMGWLLKPFTIFTPLADARQRGYVLHVALVVQNVATSLFSLAFLIAGAGIAGMFLAAFLANLAMTAILARDAASFVSPRAALLGPTDPDARRELRSLNGWSMLLSILGRICVLSDTIVLSLFLGVGVVTPFVITLRLPALAGAQLSSLGNSSWAALSELYHQNLVERMNARLVQLTRLTAFAGLAALIPIAIGNGVFVRAWMGPEQDAGRLVTLLGCANAWMVSIVSLWSWVLNGTGHLRAVARVHILETALNVVVSVVATLYIGPAGPLIGTAAHIFGISFWWLPQLLHWHLAVSRRELFLAVFKPFLLGIVFLAVLSPLEISWLDRLQLSRFAAIAVTLSCMGVVAAIYLAMGWWLVLPQSDRDEVLKRIRRRPATNG